MEDVLTLCVTMLLRSLMKMATFVGNMLYGIGDKCIATFDDVACVGLRMGLLFKFLNNDVLQGF